MRLINLWQRLGFGRDKCVFCKGHKGGTPGNENLYVTNRLNKVAVCDDCSVILDAIIAYDRWERANS